MPPPTANEIIRQALRSYGLEALLDDQDLDLIGAWQSTGNMDAVWARVQTSQSYADRFPAMQALADAGRAVDEGTYIQLERQYASILSMYGMPAGFYDDPSDFGNLIAGDVSPQEFSQRVGLAAEAAMAANADVATQLRDYYQITEQDLTAYYLDPEKAANIFEERERFGTARIGAAATDVGFGSIDRQTAERISATGVTETQARRGFQAVAGSTLAEETASETDDLTGGELIEAEFGLDVESAMKAEERRQRRVAEFSGSGGPAFTRSGYTGLGTAN